MRRILLALMTTVAVVVTMFGYRTSTPHPAVTTTAVAAGSAGGTAPATAPPAGAGTTATGTRTVTGSAVDTRWGTVQVQITVSGGKVTAVTPVQVPANNPRDVEINNYAVPVLTQEALQAQSAHIDSVSGASVTSGGYIASLQSALDAAGL